MSAFLAINWEFELRGILTVIMGVAVLMGSVYLVLMTNVGARLVVGVGRPALHEWGMHRALERVVRHCLEKNPYERFQSARDLKFDLSEIIASPSGSSSASQVSGITPVPPAARRPRAIAIASLGGLALAVAAALGWMSHRVPVAGQVAISIAIPAGG